MRRGVGVSEPVALIDAQEMSKASAAFRRGSVRLRSSLGSGHTSLNLAISEQSSVRQRYKDLIVTETSAAHTLQQWSQSGEIPALQDVLHSTYELTLMWAEAQREYIAALKEYKRVYEHILEMDKKLDQAKKQLAACEEKERKIQKELVKGPKEPAQTQEKLRLASDSKMLADAEMSGQQKETEAMKLMSVRAGLLDISRAWASMGRKCSILAKSQKELALLIPDVTTRVQDIPTYCGSRDSTRIIHGTRSQLEHTEPPAYGSGMASYPPSSKSRPSSAGARYPSLDHSISGRRFSEPDQSSPARHAQVLNTIEQEYDSFDSFESD